MRPTTLGNWVTVTVLLEGSTVDTEGGHNAVLFGGGGIGGLEDDAGEVGQDIEAYGAPGIVWRPRAPEEIDGETVGAELVALRVSDDVLPAAVRDLRWNRAFPAPKPGTVALVGYGGGFLSFDDVDGGEGTIQVFYCPYSFTNGVAGKAHSITLDPDEETITVVHGDGAAIILDDESLIMRSPDGSARIEIRNGSITIVGNVTVVGGLVAGVNPLNPAAVGVPVLCGPSPGVPSISLMVATP